MWAPIFNMGNIYAGMNYISALNQFSFGSFIPNMFNYSFIPSFYNSSIFSYMGASRVPDIDDITKSIVSSTLSPYKSVKTAKKVAAKKVKTKKSVATKKVKTKVTRKKGKTVKK